VQLLKEGEMEDDRSANSVLSKMSLQDQKALYSVSSVDGDSALSTDGDPVTPDGKAPSSL
jgi:hypothetical protein